MDGRRNIGISFLNEIEPNKKKEIEHEVKLITKTDYHKSKMEYHGIEELEKNNIEKKICKDLIDATNQVLIDLKLKKFADAFAITPDDIHLLDEDAYQASFTPSDEVEWTPKAYHEYSNVYLNNAQCESYGEFAFVVAHELSHCYAYKKLETEVDADGEGSNNYGLIREGAMHGDAFWGMNEAATEMLARRIRIDFNERNKQISFENKKKIEHERIYERVILIIEAIVRQISSSHEEEEKLTDELLSNQITGSDSFLKKAELKIPGVTEVLSTMSVTYESTLEAAKKLGFQDVAKEIERIRRIKEPGNQVES